MSKRRSNAHIVQTREPRVEVRASPGSGKTYTLDQRVKHLADSGVPDRKILVLAFSNAAVREIKARMTQHGFRVPGQSAAHRALDADAGASAGSGLSAVTVQTAHAFARGLIAKKRVLKDKPAQDMLSKAIRTAQKDCRARALWPDKPRATRRLRTTQLKQLPAEFSMKTILSFFDMARASKQPLKAASVGQFAAFKPYAQVLNAVRRKYSDLKDSKHVIDFGDMLVMAVKAIKDGASVPYSHILVDEYQDCSAAQVHLLVQLARTGGRSIMVFGDPYQAIFGFAGASYTPLSTVLKGVKTYRLPVSRRLTAQTAALASAVVEHGPAQAIKTLRNGKKPVLVLDTSLDTQTLHIVLDIRRLIEHGTRPEDIAVLARAKALLMPVEQALLANGVQTNRIGLARDPQHALHVLRLVGVMERWDGAPKSAITADMLRDELPRLVGVSKSQWSKEAKAIKKACRVKSLEGRYRVCASAYLRLLGGVRKDRQLRADVNRWEPICRGQVDSRSMRATLRAIRPNAVLTSTIHSAKGGEWKHVFIVGVTDGLLPLYLSRNDEPALNEERRLLYVAITRACDAVRLYHAPTSHAKSKQQFESLSRFVDDKAVRKTLSIMTAKTKSSSARRNSTRTET